MLYQGKLMPWYGFLAEEGNRFIEDKSIEGKHCRSTEKWTTS